MSELKQFKLPDVGEGLTEADIVRWRVRPGDPVAVNQPIVEIETAKALVELPSPFDGTVHSLLVGEGETVDVGTPIISVDVSAEPAGAGGTADAVTEAGPKLSAERLTRASPPPLREPASGRAPATPSAAPSAAQPGGPSAAGGPREPDATGGRQPVLVGYGVKPGSTTRRPRKTPTAQPAAPTGQPAAQRKP